MPNDKSNNSKIKQLKAENSAGGGIKCYEITNTVPANPPPKKKK